MKGNELVNNTMLDAATALLGGYAGVIVAKAYDGTPPATVDGDYSVNNLLVTYALSPSGDIAWDAAASSQVTITAAQTIEGVTVAGNPTHLVVCRADDAMTALTPGTADYPRIQFDIPVDATITLAPFAGAIVAPLQQLIMDLEP